MAHGEISVSLPAPSAVAFDLLHDYRRRLEWDTLLRAAYLEGDHATAGEGVPTLAAVKMVNAPPFFGAWAASIRHEDLSAHESRITYTFHFTARPRSLRFILEPVMKAVFIWETRKRLRSLRTYLGRTYQAQGHN
jgi:hypothetical protein